ncbi:MAG: molybdopterin cofactor-binding domain-containing protein, partial [Actinomycetota bacterium]
HVDRGHVLGSDDVEAPQGQIEGSVHMGLGYALSEGFPCDPDGRPLNSTLRSLDIIRPKDMPPVDVLLVESPEPNSPYGIKGVGEIGLVPTAGAVAEALRSHDGQWRNELPMHNEANRERADAWSRPGGGTSSSPGANVAGVSEVNDNGTESDT